MFYSEADRLIYEAPNGTKYDPLALHRSLILASSGKIASLLATWTDPETTPTERAVAEEAVVAAARTAFQFRPFTEPDGVVDGIALGCLRHFLEWLEKNESRA